MGHSIRVWNSCRVKLPGEQLTDPFTVSSMFSFGKKQMSSISVPEVFYNMNVQDSITVNLCCPCGDVSEMQLVRAVCILCLDMFVRLAGQSGDYCKSSFSQGSTDSIPIYQHSYLGYGILAIRTKLFQDLCCPCMF